jgi:predicted nicotinamide N-methyase
MDGEVTVPEARSNPRLRRFGLRTLRVPLGKEVLALAVPDSRRWLREGRWVPAAERGAEPPYWVEIWPASLAVARLLVRKGDLADVQVLDLGCGLGVPGIAASSLGAEVTFADREEAALEFAQWNASAVQAGVRTSRRQQLDWFRQDIAGRFDIVILADVTYARMHHGPLRRQLERCLAPAGVVVHADPGRPEAGEFLEGLGSEFSTIACLRETCTGTRRVDVRLVVASRNANALRPWKEVFDRDRSARPWGTPVAVGADVPACRTVEGTASEAPAP